MAAQAASAAASAAAASLTARATAAASRRLLRFSSRLAAASAPPAAAAAAASSAPAARLGSPAGAAAGEASRRRFLSLVNVSFGPAAVPSAVRFVASASAGGVQSVPVEEAQQLVASGSYTYLDVRTPEEFAAGHVEGAVNIPFLLRGNGGMVKNDSFLSQVEADFPQDTPLLVACQGGVRSIKAANELADAGFSSVLDVAGGFAAWASRGLPTVR